MLKPNLIDPVAFAKDERLLQSQVALAELDSRVSNHEFLADTSGDCVFSLQGGRDRYRRLFLDLSVRANLNLSCQRCLEVLPILFEEKVRIFLYFDENKLDEAMMQDETLEGIMAAEELSINTLLEDQIIMGLPLAPKHEECNNADLARINQDKPNPFAALASLKK